MPLAKSQIRQINKYAAGGEFSHFFSPVEEKHLRRFTNTAKWSLVIDAISNYLCNSNVVVVPGKSTHPIATHCLACVWMVLRIYCCATYSNVPIASSGAPPQSLLCYSTSLRLHRGMWMCDCTTNMIINISDKIAWADKVDKEEVSWRKTQCRDPRFHGSLESKPRQSGVCERGGGGAPYQAIT